MKSSRLLHILLLLQSRGRMTAPQLARELEVCVRTVYRDVAALAEAGVPIYSTGGSIGGYQLVAGYQTRLTGLTTEEAQALLLIGLRGPAAQLGLGPLVERAELKVRSSLPDHLRDRLDELRELIHIDPPARYQEPGPAQYLIDLQRALRAQIRVRVTYQSSRDESPATRVLEPLGLVLKAGSWYLVAATPGRAPQTFSVERISRLDLTNATFVRSRDFDLGAHWDAGLAALGRARFTGTAVVRATERGRARLRRQLGGRAGDVLLINPLDGSGWAVLRIPIEHYDQAAIDLLRLAPDVEVLHPDILRRRVTDAISVLHDLYNAQERDSA